MTIVELSRNTEERPRLLYLFPRRSTFIQRDLDLLTRHFDVHAHELCADPPWMLPLRLLGQLIWLMRRCAWRHDAICHFSGYHAVLPVLMAKRCFIVLAGADCASIPAIGYGNHAREPLGRATRFAARRAHRLLPVHELLIDRVQHYDAATPSRQGIRAFAPGLGTPSTAIPYGFDAEQWKPDPAIERRPDLFVSVVGPAAEGNRIHFLKGVDMVLAAAGRVPQARFVLIGIGDPRTYAGAPANVELVPNVPQADLRRHYCSASFYLQLSLSEGFPNALCEAMLCGCIPLVSDVSSMPSTVKDIGLVVRRRDPELVTATIREALAMDAGRRRDRSRAARERIAGSFSVEAREHALVNVIRE